MITPKKENKIVQKGTALDKFENLISGKTEENKEQGLVGGNDVTGVTAEDMEQSSKGFGSVIDIAKPKRRDEHLERLQKAQIKKDRELQEKIIKQKAKQAEADKQTALGQAQEIGTAITDLDPEDEAGAEIVKQKVEEYRENFNPLEFQKGLQETVEKYENPADLIAEDSMKGNTLSFIGKYLFTDPGEALSTIANTPKSAYDPEGNYIMKGVASLLQLGGDLLDSNFGLKSMVTASKREDFLEGLSPEQKAEYSDAKESLRVLNVPEVYKAKSVLDEQIRKVENAYNKTPGTNQLDRGAYASTLEDLKRRRETANDILSGKANGGAGENTMTFLRETIGKNIVDLSELGKYVSGEDREREFVLFSNTRKEFSQFWSGASNIANRYEEDYLKPYLKEKGKTIEEMNNDDYKKVFSEMETVDQLLLESKIVSQESAPLNELTGFWYQQAEGAGHSVEMMLGMFGGSAAMKQIGRVAKAVSGASKVDRTLRAVRQADKINKGLRLSHGKGLTFKGITKAKDLGNFVGAAGLQTMIDPMFVNEELDRAGYGWVKDNEGKIVAGTAGQGFKKHLIGELEEHKVFLKDYVESFNSQDPEREGQDPLFTSDEQRQRYEEAQQLLGITPALDQEGNKIMTLDEQIEMYDKESNSKFNSYLRGFLTGGLERVAELYTIKGIKAIKKGGTLLGNKVGLGNTIESLSKRQKLIETDFYNFTKIGKKIKKVSQFQRDFLKINNQSVINDLPTEVAEEYFVELSQPLIDTATEGLESGIGSLQEAKNTLTSQRFHVDVIVQSSLIKSLFGAGGAVRQGAGMLHSGAQQSALKKQRETVQDIRDSYDKETNEENKVRIKSKLDAAESYLNNMQENSTIFGFDNSISRGVGQFSSSIRQGVERGKAVQKVVDDIRSSNTLDPETIDFIKHFDPSERSLKDVKKKIMKLEKEGKTQEAEQLRSYSMSMLVEGALETDMLDPLIKSLDDAIKDSKGKNPESLRKITKLRDTAKKIEKHFKRHSRTPRSIVAAKFLLEQDINRNAIEDIDAILSMETDDAFSMETEDSGGPRTMFSEMFKSNEFKTKEITEAEASVILDDFYTNPYEEGTQLYKDFSSIQNTLLDETQRDSSLASRVRALHLKDNLTRNLEDARKRFSEAMNPTLDVAYSERFMMEVEKEIKEETGSKGFLTDFELDSAIEYAEAFNPDFKNNVSENYQKLVKDRFKTAQRLLKSKVQRDNLNRQFLEEAMKQQQEAETEGEGTPTQVAPTPQSTVDPDQIAKEIAALENNVDFDPSQEPVPEAKPKKTAKKSRAGRKKAKKSRAARKKDNAEAAPKPEKTAEEMFFETGFGGTDGVDDSLDLSKADSKLDPKILEQYKSLIVAISLSLGDNSSVSFTDIVNEVLAKESNPGSLFLSVGGFGYAIKAWEGLNTEFGKEGEPAFKKGELAMLKSNVNSKIEQLGNRALAYKQMATEASEEVTKRENPEKGISTEQGLVSKGVRKIKSFLAPLTSAQEKEGVPVKTGATFVYGQKPRLGFLGLSYMNVLNSKGEVEKVTTDTSQLQADKTEDKWIKVDPRPLLHPDNVDNELGLEIVKQEDWDNVPISDYDNTDELDNSPTISFQSWVDKKTKEDPNFLESEEFLERVPVYATQKGKRVAYIHEQGWFNGYNVPAPFDNTGDDYVNPADANDNLLWKKEIDLAKARNFRLRRAILTGKKPIKKIKFSKSGEGKFAEVPQPQDAISISEANPQAIMFVQTSAGMKDILINGLDRVDDGFKDGSKKLLNSPSDFVSDKEGRSLTGYTWAVYRVGTEISDTTGKKVETYRALLVLRLDPTFKQETETILRLFAAHTILSGETVNNPEYNMSEKMAKEYLDEYTDVTDEGIEENKNFAAFFGTMYKVNYEYTNALNNQIRERKTKQLLKQGVDPKLVEAQVDKIFRDNRGTDYLPMKEVLAKALDISSSKNRVDYLRSKLVQNTSSASLVRNKETVIATKDGVVGSGVTYKQDLKQKLSIRIKSFNMSEEGKAPVYGTVVQPILDIQDDFEGLDLDTESAPVITKKEYEATKKKSSLRKEKGEPVTNMSEERSEEILSFLEGKLKTGLDSFYDTEGVDDTIDLETLSKNFINSISGIASDRAQSFINLIANVIVGKAEFRDKLSSNSTVVIKAVAQKRVEDTISPLVETIDLYLNELLSLSSPTNTQKAMIKGLQSNKESLSKVIENFDDLFLNSLTKVNEITNIDTTDYQNDNTSEEEKTEKNYSKDSIEETVKSKATGKLKMLLSGIPVYNSDGTVEQGYGGIPNYMSLDDAYNLVLKALSVGIDPRPNFDTMVDKLRLADNPAIQTIIERLKNADQQLKNQFVVNSAMHSLTSRFTMYQVENNGKVKLKFFNTNSSTTRMAVVDNWKNNTNGTKLYDEKGNFNSVFAQEMLDRFKSFPNSYSDLDVSELRIWLEDMGIDLHNKTWESIIEQGIASGNSVFSLELMYESTKSNKNKTSIFNSINKFLNEGIKDPDSHGIESSSLYDDIGGITNAMAEVEAFYNPELISLVFRDSGKTISTLTPPKFITDEVAKLLESAKGDKEYIDEILSFAYSSESLILQTLKDRPEFADFFKVHHISLTSLKNRDKNTSGDKKANTLDNPEFLLLAMGAFQDRKNTTFKGTTPQVRGIATRMGHMLSPTMSDKDTSLAFGTVLLDLAFSKKKSFNTNEEGEIIGISDSVTKALYKYTVKNQVKKILEYNRKAETTNIKGYDIAADLFIDYPGLNSLQIDGTNLARFLKEAPNSMSDKEIEQKVQPVIEQFLGRMIEKEATSKYQVIEDNVSYDKGGKRTNIFVDSTYAKEGEIKDSNSTEASKIAAYDFVVNNILFNAEVNKLFVSDLALYHKHKFPVDKSKYDLTTAEYLKMSKETGVNIGKRLALLIAPGRKIANIQSDISDKSSTKYNQIFLKDPIDISENINQLIDWFYPDRDNDKIKEEVAELAKLRSSTQSDEVIDKHDKMLKKLEKDIPEIVSYLEIESADAQEYTTVGEHLYVMYAYGQLTEKEYKDLKTSYNNNTLSPEQRRKVLQPMKPVHTGIYNDKVQGVRRVVYIKSSSMPLIPELTKGTTLDNLRVEMEAMEERTGRFTRASYQTANKVGAMINTINPNDKESVNKLSDQMNSSMDETPLEHSSMVLDRNNFRIQQDVPHKSSKSKQDKVSMGTQIFKLILGDGVLQTKGNVFPYKGKMVSAKTLEEEFNRSFGDIIENQKKTLYEDLGVNEQGKIESPIEFKRKMSELLLREAKERGYDIKSQKGLELRVTKDASGKETVDFVTPLWLSSEGNKYEALLNSIITNRLMQFKMPGNAFVAASENGFDFKEGLDFMTEEDRNKVIYLPGYNGEELQATRNEEGGISKAQVMIESKFKDSEGNLIDLFEGFDGLEGKYVEVKENGTHGLKEGMIDTELMNIFSFRTPTSGHVSASSVEIVGILPASSGDVMVVPKNFTQQKGLDFDVDKESAYMLNHFIDEEGRVRVIGSEEYNYQMEFLKENAGDLDGYTFYTIFDDLNLSSIVGMNDRRLSDLSYKSRGLAYKLAILEAPQSTSSRTNEIVNKVFDVETKDVEELKRSIRKEILLTEEGSTLDKVLKELKKDFESELNNFDGQVKSYIAAKLSVKAQRKLETKEAENDFIRVHLSVMNADSDDVQRRINKILSMDFSKGQADKIEELKEQGRRSKEIKKIRRERNLGSQQAENAYEEESSYFNLLSHDYQKEKMDLGAIGKKAIGIYSVAVTFNSLVQQTYGSMGMGVTPFVIGKSTSNSLGAVMSLTPDYTTSEMLMEKQNTATDNEKEQVLGRVGVNDFSISVDSFASLRGFAKDENGNSVIYTLLSQPSVVEVNRLFKQAKSSLGEYRTEAEIVNDLLLSMGSEIYYKDKDIPPTAEEVGFYPSRDLEGETELLPTGSADLTGNAMLKGIKKGEVNTDLQVEALKVYFELYQESKNYIKPMGALNNNQLGKSMLEAGLKSKKLRSVLGDPKFLPLFGKRLSTSTKDTYDFEVMTRLGPVFYHILPTTPQGKIAIEGLKAQENLLQPMFPYQKGNLDEMLTEILEIKGISEDFVTAENLEKIVNEYKKYIFSSEHTSLFTSSVQVDSKRLELFKDSNNNTSLSTYISKTLKSGSKDYSKGIQALKNNPLVGKKLKYLVGKGDTEASRIEYNNASSEHIDDSQLYDSLPQLALMDLPLPDKNGKPYSTSMLVEDLIKYSLLEGGLQEAKQFIKYVPTELMSVTVGQSGQSINSKLRELNNSDPQTFLKLNRNFIRQYFQNNPEEATFPNFDRVNFNSTGFTLGVSSGEITKPFVKIKNKKKETVLYSLTGITQGKASYAPISSMLTKRVSQYNPFSKDLVDMNGYVSKKEKDPVVDQDDSLNLQGVETVRQLLNRVKTQVPEFTAIVDLYLKGITDEKVSLSKGGGIASAVRKTGAIKINIDKLSKLPIKEAASVVLHEASHTLTAREIIKYFDITKGKIATLRTQGVDGTVVPQVMKDLSDIHIKSRSAMSKYLKETYDMPQEDFDNILSTIENTYVKRETDKTYSVGEDLKPYSEKYNDKVLKMIYFVLNPLELQAGLVESPEFREALNVPYKSLSKTILQELIDVLKTILKSAFPQVKDGTIASEGLSTIFIIMKNSGVDLSDNTNPDIEQGPPQGLFPSDTEFFNSAEDNNIDFSQLEQEENNQSFNDDVENNLNFVFSESGQSLTELGVNEEEWSALTEEEKDIILKCN